MSGINDATFFLTGLQFLVEIGLFRGGKENFNKVKDLVEDKDTTEDSVGDWIYCLDRLERDWGVRGLATAKKLKECAQELVRKMQQIREKYGKCRGSNWLVLRLNPRVYSDGSELKELERRFEVLVDKFNGVFYLWLLLCVGIFILSCLGGGNGGLVFSGRRIC
ncbi:uncharacterized protein BO87DRAFT_373196 [Aspergillus neoniger CBS 115656]|uniref:Uncharacterized protein n=1 Tax=Aspergillus neoniger (strain CBS 115656) TaxID=1448310 RepID=A0A318YZU1_ASPNB|nr:hypothetical protein BO87DRAFT_373196 [Aspergillus neoniger CBS 115656]PYH38323.1 hypothetical protein BO87DRAFT_373196 [Aspergillus neoniger CBS 115656]